MSVNESTGLYRSLDIPPELYESSLGNYFIGFADGLSFGRGTGAWARLYNPPGSGVDLFVNVWTVTEISNAPFTARFWFNSHPRGRSVTSDFVTASNSAIRPVPRARVRLQYASQATGNPIGGTEAFARTGNPGATLVESENGKLIFPPGGSFMVFLTLSGNTNAQASGRVAFGWWEEKTAHGAAGRLGRFGQG